MPRVKILLFAILFPFSFFAQELVDRIFTKKGDTITCKITLVNENNIFYEYGKRKNKDSYISLNEVVSYNWISKNIPPQSPVQEKQYPSYFSHCFGAGAQFLPSKEYASGHESYTINYLSPSPFAFYNLQYETAKQNKLCVNLSANYRQGNGESYSGALGGGTYKKGNFELVRACIGPSFLWSFGKRRGTSLGVGVTIGFLTYCTGSATEYQWSMNSPNSEPKVVNVRSTINPITIGFNIELNQQFKLRAGKFLVIGIKGIVEGPDGYSYFRNLYGSIFLAYKFRAKSRE